MELQVNTSKNDETAKQLGDLSYFEEGEIAIIRFNELGNKVNTLNSRMLPQMEEVLTKIEKSQHIKAAVILSSKKDCFVAGADIKELKNATSSDQVMKISMAGQKIFTRLQKLNKPVVAGIHGACMGGGLELALACHYRVASLSDKTLFSLPEVLLGLLPAAGGTQRLPKLIGYEKALSMMLTGSPVKAIKAKKLGIVDYITTEAGLEFVAIEAARKLTLKPVKRKLKLKGVVGFLEKTKVGRDVLFSKALKSVEKKTKGLYPAPKAIIDVISVGSSSGLEKGLEREAWEFGNLSQTNESKNLISLYLAQTSLKKNRFETPSQKIDSIGVIGSGLMGAGISLVSAQKNFSVHVKDLNHESLASCQKNIWKELDRKVKRKSLSHFQANNIFSRIKPHVDYNNFNKCRLVIEAVFENLDLKHQIIKELESILPEDAVIASNTSALPITDIASASRRPSRILGMHYFSPVHKMPLLEIITTDKTDNDATSLAVDVGLRQGKTVIVVKDGPGFYTTRILAPFMDEAALVCLEGMSFLELDKTMQEMGYPVGPITLMDEVGLDVALHVSSDLGKAFGKRIRSQETNILGDLIEKGALGKKSGSGFYKYKNKKSGFPIKIPLMNSAVKEANPFALNLIKKYKKGTLDPSSKKDIQNRLMYRMLNEAVYCLQEGVLSNATDGDIGAVFGLGFPPIYGGPFRLCDQKGISRVVDEMNELSDRFGERFAPCDLLQDMAKNQQSFYND